MLIDWFTVGAQVLNFVVLVWLMKRFLYKPVQDAIDAREKRIAAELADADQKKAAAQTEGAELQRKNEDFDKERAALLAKAVADADAERKKLIDAAHQAADALSAARRLSMAGEAKALAHTLRERAQTEVFAVARKALKDLASTDLEASVCEMFVMRLHALDGPALDAMKAALKSSHDGALVRTAFELPAAQRTAVHEAINETFAVKVALTYEVAPRLVGGIELSASGQKLAWTIGDYLESLERGVVELLKPPAEADAKPDAKHDAKKETKPAEGAS